KLLERKFWETLERKLREKLTPPMGWEIYLNMDETGKEIYINGGLELYPESPSNQYLYPCIAGDELCYGLAWAREVRRPLLPEVTRLQQTLQARDYKSTSWWLAYKNAAGGVRLRTNQMYVRIATDNHLDLAEGLASALKELFENTRTMIEDANRSIVQEE